MTVKRSDRRTEFERLYRQHRTAIIRYLLRQGARPDEVEDIAQTAFLHAYRAYAAGTRPEEPRRWLYAVARNTHRRRFRALAARFRHVEIDPELPTAERDPLLVRELAGALAELPPRQRVALVQRELLGLEYEEIARRLDVSVASVQMLLFRARKTLRRRRLGLGPTALLQPLVRAGESAWSWVQRLGPAEGAAGALAVAVAGTAAVASAPAKPAALGPVAAARVAPAPARLARRPLAAAPLGISRRAPARVASSAPSAADPPAPASPAAPPARRPVAQPKAPPPAAAAIPPPAPPTTTAATTAEAAAETTETATSPLQVTVPALSVDAAVPPEPPAPVSVPVSTPSLTVTTPSLPIPVAPTTTVTNGLLP